MSTPYPQLRPDSEQPSRIGGGSLFPFLPNGQLRREIFEEVRERYFERCGFNLLYSDAEGNLLFGLPECRQFPCKQSCRECRKATLERSIFGGRAELCACADQYALWSIPLMINQSIQGGLIVVGVSLAKDGASNAVPAAEACEELLKIAVDYNITNREYLKSRRDQYLPPRLAPEAFETPTLSMALTFRSLKGDLERQEAELTTAILRENRPGALQVLQAIFETVRTVAPISHPVLQGYGMHLLALMHESVQTASGRYAIVLEHSYTGAARLIAREDTEGVCEELENALSQLLDLMQRQGDGDGPGKSRFARALSYMENHFQEPLTRQDVARAAGISESHLSRLLKHHTGRSFTDILNRFRLDRSAQLLMRKEKSILNIALEVGFSDQSYFGRVFRRYYGVTPDQFRQQR